MIFCFFFSEYSALVLFYPYPERVQLSVAIDLPIDRPWQVYSC